MARFDNLTGEGLVWEKFGWNPTRNTPRLLKSDYDLDQYFVFIQLKTFPQETVEPLTSACLDIVRVFFFFKHNSCTERLSCILTLQQRLSYRRETLEQTALMRAAWQQAAKGCLCQ